MTTKKTLSRRPLFTMTKKNPVKSKRLRCQNPKCGNIWDYKGKAPFYTTCPKCLYKVNIQKASEGKR